MARVIETSVRIQAAPSRVWSVLMEFSNYPSWNPFIRSIKGDARSGAALEVVIAPPGRKAQTFRPIVLDVVPEKVFCWRGALPIPGLFTGEHRFVLTEDAGATQFAQSERFTGLFVPLLGDILDATEAGFRNMNTELKTRAENF